VTAERGEVGTEGGRRVAKQAVAELAALAVEKVLAAAAHPLRTEIDLVREWTRDAVADVEEGVKWNAPSFRTQEWFATIHLRTTVQVQVVLHLGAKAAGVVRKAAIPDPEGLLKWLGEDRAMASLGSGTMLRGRRAAWQRIVAAWVGGVGGSVR
jgi:hypothetical protein